MSRSFLALFVLLTVLGQPQFSVSAADIPQGGCPTEIDSTFACRSYHPESGDLQGKVDRLTFIVLRYGSIPVATEAFSELGVQGYPSDSKGKTFDGVSLGDEYAYHPPAQASSNQHEVSYLKVRDGNIISLWIVEGNDTDLATTLSISYTKWDRPQGSAANTANITEFLPAVTIFPTGMVLSDEYAASAEEEPEKAVTRTPRSTAEPTPTVSRTTRSSTSSTSSTTSPSTSSGPIEILDISNKDAGFGNGNYYIYVEVKNTSGRSLSYVQVDLTCRDSGDTVVGTGIANYAGMAPGETTVLTGLVFDVPDCVRINAKVNPLTG